jgi:hypothetical protein
MSGETDPDTPCELCGDLTPDTSLCQDPDQGWEALGAACWQLQQPPEPPSLWPQLPGRQGLGRTRRDPVPPEDPFP